MTLSAAFILHTGQQFVAGAAVTVAETGACVTDVGGTGARPVDADTTVVDVVGEAAVAAVGVATDPLFAAIGSRRRTER